MKIIKIVCVLLVLVVMGYLYFYAVHPIICKYYISTDVYTGIEVYQNEIYLEHEDGHFFKKYFSALDYFEEGEVKDFYYGDNEALDNPIHGRACDVLAIDIQLPKQRFQEVVSTIVTSGLYNPYPGSYEKPEGEKWMPNGFVYWLPVALNGDKCNFVYANNNKDQIIRVIMVTDTEDYESGFQLLSIIENRSVLME